MTIAATGQARQTMRIARRERAARLVLWAAAAWGAVATVATALLSGG